MTFSEKLDVLLSLTGTSNSALGRALSYDPSYISRVRAGKRGLPRRQPFLQPASEYFAQVIVTPLQQNTASNLMTPGQPWPNDPDKAADHILHWLEASPEDMNEPIGQFFESLTQSLKKPDLPPALEFSQDLPEEPAFFYGNKGKRDAVLRFLADLCVTDSARSLQLVSDESMDWLTEDAAFARQWAALLHRFLERGGHITIIHTIDRDLSEMLGALQQWIPLYFSGNILSYYCPRLRDGICRRSLFVAPGRAALVSSSIENKTAGMVNLYTRRPDAVAAYGAEFANYLTLCRPLMDVYSEDKRQDLLDRLLSMIQDGGPLFFASSVPLPFSEEIPALEPLRQAFQDHLAMGGKVTELLHLPEPKAAVKGPVFLPLGDLLGVPGIQISPQRLREQAAALPERMAVMPHYRGIFSQRLPDSVSLLARGREEVVLFPSAPPSTAFAVTEPRLTSALWDYLQRAAGPGDQHNSARRLDRWLASMDKQIEKQAARDKKKAK